MSVEFFFLSHIVLLTLRVGSCLILENDDKKRWLGIIKHQLCQVHRVDKTRKKSTTAQPFTFR